MGKSLFWLERQIACGLALLMIVPLGVAEHKPLPDAPVPQQAVQQQPAKPAQNTAPAPGNQQDQTNQQTTSQPVGTAVAPAIKPEGATASRPAGAAIAPAKQRRTRTFAIRMALIVGAAVAVGTVAAASLGSPARPH